MKITKISQSSLPDEITQPLQKDAVFSNGFSLDQRYVDNEKTTPKKFVYIRQTNHDFYSSSASIGIQPIQLVGPDPTRRFLLIQNQSLSTIYLGFGQAPSITGLNSIELSSGFQISWENGIVPNNSIFGISATSARITILSGRESGQQ